MTTTIERLESTIRKRRIADRGSSYVARLLAEGRGGIARKVGEEAVETVVAAMSDDKDATKCEAADLLFHLAVLLADMELSFADVFAELDRREGVSGIAEKASRKV